MVFSYTAPHRDRYSSLLKNWLCRIAWSIHSAQTLTSTYISIRFCAALSLSVSVSISMSVPVSGSVNAPSSWLHSFYIDQLIHWTAKRSSQAIIKRSFKAHSYQGKRKQNFFWCFSFFFLWSVSLSPPLSLRKVYMTYAGDQEVAGVAPEVNLRKCVTHTPPPNAYKVAHPCFEILRRCHQMSKIGVSVAPQKGLMSSKNQKKKF